MMTRIAITNAALIQSGERTQSQDQSMIPQSLSTMNAIARNPPKPMPLADAVAFADAFE